MQYISRIASQKSLKSFVFPLCLTIFSNCVLRTMGHIKTLVEDPWGQNYFCSNMKVFDIISLFSLLWVYCVPFQSLHEMWWYDIIALLANGVCAYIFLFSNFLSLIFFPKQRFFFNIINFIFKNSFRLTVSSHLILLIDSVRLSEMTCKKTRFTRG